MAGLITVVDFVLVHGWVNALYDSWDMNGVWLVT
jgi:hypothetical protein